MNDQIQTTAPPDTWTRTLDAWVRVHADASRAGDAATRRYAWARILFWLGVQ